MASSFSLKTGSYDGRYLQLSCSQTKDIATNKSTISWTLTSTGGSVNYYDTGPTDVYIGGKHVYHRDRVAWSSYAFPAARGSVSGTVTIDHSADGSKTISCSVSTAIYTGTVSTSSKNWTLDNIPRAATLTSAPNFTDEENPTIVYSNPAGNAVDSVQVCITNADASVQLAKYREVSKTGTSYTFNLTDAERTALINSTPDGGNTAYVRFYIKTYIGGALVEDPRQLTRILTVVNTTPVITASVKDIGDASTVLTGNSSKIIKGFNYVSASMSVALKKGATLKTYYIKNGSQTQWNTSANFSNVENGTFEFGIKDSFGNEITKPVTLTVIPYVKLTCNVKANNPTADGNLAFKISGNYFNNTFGAVANTLAVYWRIKENDGAYGDWNVVTPTLSGNTYSHTVNLTGLNYQNTYTIQAASADKISTWLQSSEQRVKATPVFNWGENNFDINVPTTANGNVNIRQSSGDTYCGTKREGGNEVWLVSSGQTANHGVYSKTTNKWLVRSNGTDVILGDHKTTEILKQVTRPSNANDAVINTCFEYYNDVSNIPSSSNFAGWGTVLNFGNTYLQQLLVGNYTNAGRRVAIRSAVNRSWTDWEYLELKPRVLYNNTAGTTGTVTLSSSAANFSYLEIFYAKGTNNMYYKSTRIQAPDGKRVALMTGYGNADQGLIYFKSMNISGTSMTVYDYTRFEGNAPSNVEVDNSKHYVSVYKVLGYI